MSELFEIRRKFCQKIEKLVDGFLERNLLPEKAISSQIFIK